MRAREEELARAHKTELALATSQSIGGQARPGFVITAYLAPPDRIHAAC
jgi:hypothetical protein